MKKILFLCLLAQRAFFSNAQQFAVTMTDQVKLDALYNMQQYGDAFIGFEQVYGKMQLAYTFKLSKVKYGIRMVKYDKSMNLVKENRLVGGEKVFGPFTPSVYMMNNQVYLMYYKMSGESDTANLQVLASRVDTSTMELLPPKVLFTVDQRNTGLFKSIDAVNSAQLIIQQSPDKSKTLAMWRSGLNNELFLSVLDQNLDPVWSKKETVQSTVKIQLNSTGIDNQGIIYATYKSIIGKEDHQGHIWIYSPGKRTVDKEIKLAEGHPNDLNLVLPAAGPLVTVVGTYIGETQMINGVYFVQVSSTDFKLDKPKQTAVPDEMINLFEKDGWARTKKNNYGLKAINMQAYELEDGNIDMVGMFRTRDIEPRFVTEFAGDFLAVHFNKGAAVFTRLPKYRRSVESTIGDGFYVIPYKNETIIFYDDSESNLKQDIKASPNSSNHYNDLVMVAAMIPGDGTVKRETILDAKNDHWLAITESMLVQSSSSLLVPLWKIKGLGGVSDYFRWGHIEIK